MPEHESRGRLDTASLVLSLVLVLALIAYTVAGEFSRRQIDERVLRDHGAMAASELGRFATMALHDAVEEAITSAPAGARPAGAQMMRPRIP